MKDNKLTPKDFKRFGISSSQASQWIKKYYSGRSSKAVKVVCDLMLETEALLSTIRDRYKPGHPEEE